MLSVRQIEKGFDRPTGRLSVLGGIDLDIGEHAIVSLVGRSGSGKSTLLRILAGLEAADGGAVLLDGHTIAEPRPEVGVVFQEPRLMPWLSVRENVRLGLLGHAKRAQDERIDEALEAVGLADFDAALPKALSGGMAQRVALARALVRQPSVLLLDEPFSAVDAFTRALLQDHLLELWSKARFTAIFVTHDIEEAVYLSDRVILLKGRPGEIAVDLEVGLPRPRRRSDPRLSALRGRLTEALAGGEASTPG